MESENNWWKLADLTDDNPWFYIVRDFEFAKTIINRAIADGFEVEGVAIGGIPEFSSEKENMSYGLNLAACLYDEIEQAISTKKLNEETLWLWGEFQKGIAILICENPEYQNSKHLPEYSKKRMKNKQRSWCALWHEWYISNGAAKNHSAVDRLFEDLLNGIRNGKREIPSYLNKEEFLDFIKKFCSDPKDFRQVRLTKRLAANDDFSGEIYRQALAEGLKNASDLPPVGEEYYPEI